VYIEVNKDSVSGRKTVPGLYFSNVQTVHKFVRSVTSNVDFKVTIFFNVT